LENLAKGAHILSGGRGSDGLDPPLVGLLMLLGCLLLQLQSSSLFITSPCGQRRNDNYTVRYVNDFIWRGFWPYRTLERLWKSVEIDAKKRDETDFQNFTNDFILLQHKLKTFCS